MGKIQGKRAIQAYYQDDERASSYELERFSTPGGRLKHLLEISIIRSLLPQHSHEILEIAAGTGRITRELLALPYLRITVLDSSKAMLKELDLPVKKVVADAFSMPFPDSSFDGIVTMRFIRHLEKEERMQLYAELHRVLKGGGYLIFDVCNRFRHRSQIKGRAVHDELFSKKELFAELREAGFEPVCVRPYLHGLEFLLRLGVATKTIQNAILLSEKLLRRMPLFDALGYLWIVKCRKV